MELDPEFVVAGRYLSDALIASSAFNPGTIALRELVERPGRGAEDLVIVGLLVDDR